MDPNISRNANPTIPRVRLQHVFLEMFVRGTQLQLRGGRASSLRGTLSQLQLVHASRDQGYAARIQL